MEVEAKFSVPDQNTFERLLAVDRLAGLVVSTAEIRTVSDHYLDTADLAFLRRGFACRVRDSGDRVLVTLKGLGRGEDGLHSRQELEVSLEPGSGLQVTDWPPGATRDLGQEIAQESPLQTLFVVDQERHVRLLGESGSLTGAIELSLDQVHLGGLQNQVFYECEAELLPGGHMDQLLAVMEALRMQWHLGPESRSKFERGLALARPGTILGQAGDVEG